MLYKNIILTYSYYFKYYIKYNLDNNTEYSSLHVQP